MGCIGLSALADSCVPTVRMHLQNSTAAGGEAVEHREGGQGGRTGEEGRASRVKGKAPKLEGERAVCESRKRA